MQIEQLFPQEPSWLQPRTILLGKVGSHAYGTATATSDLDFKGIVVPPAEYFLGLKQFEGYDKSGGKNFKNQAGDIDMTLVHISKFVRSALSGVPNNLELLFLEETDYLYLNEHGKELLSLREHFLSKQIMYMFRGYAKSQAKKLQQLQSNGRARSDLGEKYGYDTKSYMHTVRLMESAIDVLTHHTLLVKRPNAKELVSLREGVNTLQEALEHIEELENKLQAAYQQSTLREQPNVEVVSEWLVNFNKKLVLS